MKPKFILSVLTALWAAFVLLEGVSSVLRFLYSRKLGATAKAVSGAVNYAKAAFMAALAVFNIALFMGHIDDSK